MNPTLSVVELAMEQSPPISTSENHQSQGADSEVNTLLYTHPPPPPVMVDNPERLARIVDLEETLAEAKKGAYLC